jgi:copper chaperone CopZ
MLLALAILPLSSDITTGRTDFRNVGTALAGENGTAKVIFKVKCYDEGRAALRGIKGIERIETGFHYFDETDTVYFDPKLVTVEEMESALKKAGTYVETMQEKGRN